jgi:DNA-binding transcriptional LysR family regulator
MDIRQLETFVWVARLGGIVEACKRLNVTQSTLSMRIKTLESDLRIRLFDRSHQRLTLTAKGRDLLRYAEQIVTVAEQIRLYVADPTAQYGNIRVGMSEFVALSWGPQLLRHFSQEFPNVMIDLEVGVPAALLEQLAGDKLDVLLAPAPFNPGPLIKQTSLGTVEFAWMASPSLGLPDTLVTPNQLVDLPIVSYDGRKSILFAVVQRWFLQHGLEVQRLTVSNSLATSISMIVEGLGIGILPKGYCKPLIDSRKLQVLNVEYRAEHEYFAMCRSADAEGLPSRVAELAKAVFDAYQQSENVQSSINILQL